MSNPSSPQRYVQGAAGCNLFVKNFPQDWQTQELAQLFGSHGEILSCTIFKDKISGKSKGFGFVSFATQGQAQQAIQALNGMSLGDDTLIVETKHKDNLVPYSAQHNEQTPVMDDSATHTMS